MKILEDIKSVDRRGFMAHMSALGLSGTVFPGVLWAHMQARGEITSEIVADAGAVAGLDFTDAERDMMLADLNTNLEAYEALREVAVENHVTPAVQFDPALPGRDLPSETRPFRFTRHIGLRRPADPEALAFMPLTQLSELIRTRQLSSTELTTLYLERLERHGPTLEAVITLMSDRALEHAARADREIASGAYHGPHHGIPWGAKDLLAAEGFRTTWGATPYEDRVLGEDAPVVRGLEEAGAILVAKLTMGALEAALEGIDVFITPTRAPDQLLMTNLTGHPAVVVPSGFNDDGMPVSTVFIGQLWAVADTLRVAKACQDATDFHTRRPPLFG